MVEPTLPTSAGESNPADLLAHYSDRLFVAGMLINHSVSESDVARVLVGLGPELQATSLVAALLSEGVISPVSHHVFREALASQLPSKIDEQITSSQQMLQRLLGQLFDKVTHPAIVSYLQEPPHWEDLDATPVPLAVRESPKTAKRPALVDGQNEAFQLVELHAKGGLGEIWRGWDETLQRCVAIKMMQTKVETRTSASQRFQREVRINAQLQHPSIPPVYNLGRDAETGRIFYTMRFLEGNNLEEQIARLHSLPKGPERSQEMRRLLDGFRRVCQAVSYAHNQNIIHRDLKPANIIIGEFGEAFLLDWGLARSTDGKSEFVRDTSATDQLEVTTAGSVLGSPRYMSPEQARGAPSDRQTDIYGLGAILFQLLTGVPPHHKQVQNLQQLCELIITSPSPRAKTLDKTLSPALDAICAKAMAFKPNDRYPSVDALLQDLDNLMASQPVSVMPETRLQRFARWAMRHRLLSLGGGIFSIALILTTAVIASQSWAYSSIVRDVVLFTSIGDLFSVMFSSQIEAAKPVHVAAFVSDIPEIGVLARAVNGGDLKSEAEARSLLQQGLRRILLHDSQILGIAIWEKDKQDQPLVAFHRETPFEDKINVGPGDRSYFPKDFFADAVKRRPGEPSVTPINAFQWIDHEEEQKGLRVTCIRSVETDEQEGPAVFVEVTHFFDPFLERNRLSKQLRSGKSAQWPTGIYLATAEGKILRSLYGEAMQRTSDDTGVAIASKFPFVSSLFSESPNPQNVIFRAGVGKPPASVAAVRMRINEWYPEQDIILAAATQSSQQDTEYKWMRRFALVAGGIVLLVCLGGVAFLWRLLQRSVHQLD